MNEHERQNLCCYWHCRGVHRFPVWWVGCRTENPDPVYGGGLCHRAYGRGHFHNSRKTETGSLESLAGWKGLCRKGVSLLIVLVACRLDLIMGSSFIRDATVVAFVANETISIIENAGLMGVPIPEVITKSIEVLKNKAEKEGG